MGFISFSLDYYAKELQKLESSVATEETVYHAMQLLKMLDDLLDEGYTELNKKMEEEYIEIVLADKGPGIPDIDLAMQEGYSTARDNIRALGFGAGMGLPNMKRYTDEMKIESTVGVGTTITMCVYLK